MDRILGQKASTNMTRRVFRIEKFSTSVLATRIPTTEMRILTPNHFETLFSFRNMITATTRVIMGHISRRSPEVTTCSRVAATPMEILVVSL